MKKKSIIITILLILIICALYAGTWLFYYLAVWMPHVTEDAHHKIRKDKVSRTTAYEVAPDDRYDSYSIIIPWFGSFHCYCTMSSAIGFDEDKFVIDENGEKSYSYHTMSGSDFDYNMTAPVKMNGKIDTYYFNVNPFTDKYTGAAEFVLDKEGNLLNEEELSKKEIEMYQDASSELKAFIAKTQSIFNI